MLGKNRAADEEDSGAVVLVLAPGKRGGPVLSGAGLPLCAGALASRQVPAPGDLEGPARGRIAAGDRFPSPGCCRGR